MKTIQRKSGNTAPKKAEPKAFDIEKHLRLFSEATGRELATVLAAISGELDFALTTNPDKVQEKSMTMALAAAERALSLARNLRYFSVHTRLNLQVLDISQVVLDTVELVEKELELNQIKIAVLAEAGTYARVDGGAIQQLILNLLAQARRTLPKGGQITLSLRQISDKLEIKCSDTGHGIAERDMEAVFEPYGLRPDGKAASTDVHQLGLAVSKALVEAHGGEINVQSRIGSGTSVLVHLPYDPEVSKPEPFSEERRFRRIQLSLPVELLFSRGQVAIKSELTILSAGGCFTRISDPGSQPLPEINDTLSVRINYFSEAVIDIPRARVASVSWAGIHSGIGVEFVDVGERARRLLNAIVKSHSL